MPQPRTSEIQKAINYLVSIYPRVEIPDDIYGPSGVKVKHDTLQHSLRRAAREGKVEVVYYGGLAHYRAILKEPLLGNGGEEIKELNPEPNDEMPENENRPVGQGAL